MTTTSTSTPQNRIRRTFEYCKSKQRPCFVGFMTAGFPTMKDSVEILLSMQQGGVDVIELGIPFSDPLADGKMIQYANQVALTKEQMSVAKCFELLRAARAKGLKVPVVFMGYANPLFSFGLDKFLQHSKEAQVDGLILVDLPPEESQDWITKCSDNGISFVPLISPTSTEERIEKLCSFSNDGFVYVISSMGVTGQRAQVNQNLPELVKKVRKYSRIPIAVGFGVSNREQFVKVGEIADGVVMGSAFIKVVKEAHGKESIADKIAQFSRSVCGRNAPDFPPEDFKVQSIAKSDSKASTANDHDFHFGEFGGRYAPETLMYALQELEKSFQSVVKDETFWQEFKRYYPFVNRPSTLQYAANLTKHCNGARIWLKREDLNHTGSHKINNALGQALLARRLGKTNIIAETGAGQHGVATATVCAHFGLKCRIYMGKTDTERQALNVFRMRLLGAEVVPMERTEGCGEGTLKDAINEAMREWVANVENTHYLVGSAIGPHPFPKIVCEFQSVIGREVKEQFPQRFKEEIGSSKDLPDYLLACVGGGSNAIGLFHPFLNDQSVKLVGVQAAGDHGSEAPLTTGTPGVLHGCKTLLMQSNDGQVAAEQHSISAGLDYPAVGPQHAHLKSIERAQYVACTDKQALEAFLLLSQTEGIIPALETSHAIYHAVQLAKQLPADKDLIVNLSGRGDKDVQQVQKVLSQYFPTTTTIESKK